MNKFIALGALAVLSACGGPTSGVVQPANPTGAVPASVLAALPSGVPASAVQRDGNGCYSYVTEIEIVVIRHGGTAGGAQVCDA